MTDTITDPQTTLARLAERFARAVEQEFAGISPLYARLVEGSAEDAAILALAAQAPRGQPLPVFFLGAVHYLIRREPQHPLAAFYPDLAGDAVAPGDPYPAFHAFCLEPARRAGATLDHAPGADERGAAVRLPLAGVRAGGEQGGAGPSPWWRWGPVRG